MINYPKYIKLIVLWPFKIPIVQEMNAYLEVSGPNTCNLISNYPIKNTDIPRAEHKCTNSKTNGTKFYHQVNL